MKLLHNLIARSLPLAPRSLVRRFSAPYVAGETQDDALAVVAALNHKRMRATLDVLGEDISTRAEADAAAAAYCQLLDAIAERQLDANVSVKLSAFGLKLDRKVCEDNLRQILAAAAAHRNFVRIDMEDSSCTEDTLGIFESVWAQQRNVGVVLQAMLHRTLDDALRLGAMGASVRLCKGIYVEPESIAYRQPEQVRESFIASLEALFDGGSFVGIATHDEILIEAALEIIEERGLDASRYEFQMLLGVREPLRDAIVAAGHRLRVYVPFGERWYAYSLRRLRENPAIAGHVMGALMRGEGWSKASRK